MNDRLAGLVPRPRSVRAMPGSFLLTARTPVVTDRGHHTEADVDEQAVAVVRRVLSALPWPEHARPGPRISSGAQTSRASHGQTDGSQLTVTRSATGLDAEAYRLTISPGGISIEAGGVAGAFYAAQTLRQLLPDHAWRATATATATSTTSTSSTTTTTTSATAAASSTSTSTSTTTSGTGWLVPCAQIDDAPALAWRGGHLDVARHFFPKRELLTLIDAFAALKLNRLHLHLTDDQGWRVESRRYPALHEVGSHRERTRLSLSREQPPVYDETPHGGYYTLADLAEIDAYAAERMITVVPEIEVPGHASALLAALPEFGSGHPPPGGYQVLADWGIFPHLMSPLPRTIEFLREVFGELLGAVSAPYVHIGGDECVLDSWGDDPVIDAYRSRRGLVGPAELHAAFLREVADMLAGDFGARAVVWDEGFASTGGQRGLLRTDTIVMAWRGLQIARRAAEAGHDVIAAPVLPTYFDYYQSDDPAEPAGIGGPIGVRDVAAFSPVPPDWPPETRERLIGTQFQVWTEYIRNSRELEYMIFPRACVLADVAWAGQATAPGETGETGETPATRPPGQEAIPAALATRLAAHLRRLDAAGLEYRPLAGPRPWQRGGTGPRRHRAGYRLRDVTAHLNDLAAAADGEGQADLSPRKVARLSLADFPANTATRPDGTLPPRHHDRA